MSWWTLDQEDDLYEHLDDTGTSVTTVGHSVQGRPIRLVTLGSGDRADVLFVCSQHGTEPAPRDAMLDLLDAYSSGDTDVQDLFSGLKVVVVATANPDGTAAGTRGNANETDINRDWIAHGTPETQAVAEVIRDHTPKVIVDAHEAVGIIREGSDAEFRGSKHLLVHPETGDHAIGLRDRLIDHIGSFGYTTTHYGEEDGRGGYTNLDANGGIRHAVTVLIETNRNPQYTTTDRVFIQTESFSEILRWTSDNQSTLSGLREDAREWATSQGTSEAPVRINGGTLDPPPLAYILGGDLNQQSAWHRGVWWIDTQQVISLLSPYWNSAPLLFDHQSEGAPYPAEREYREGDEPPDEPDDPEDEEEDEEEDEGEDTRVTSDQESSWEATQRLAEEVQWRAFNDRQRIVFGPDWWLLERVEPWVWSEDSEEVDTIDWSVDEGAEVDQARVTMFAQPGTVNPGDPVHIQNEGMAAGEWLIEQVSEEDSTDKITVDLVRENEPLPEPEPEPEEDEDEDSEWIEDDDGGYETGVLSYGQLAWYALNAGLSGQRAIEATAIAASESSRDTRAHNTTPPDNSYGLWQINMYGGLGPERRAALGISSNDELFNPRTNARGMMLVSSNGSNWTPWSDWNNGRYRSHMAAARQGVNNPVPPGGG